MAGSLRRNRRSRRRNKRLRKKLKAIRRRIRKRIKARKKRRNKRPKVEFHANEPRPITRRRHARYGKPERSFRRTGFTAPSGSMDGVQKNLRPSHSTSYFLRAEDRLGLIDSTIQNLFRALQKQGTDRTNEITFEDVDAAAKPEDIDLE